MNTDLRNKLVLGTANFGNAYGVANKGEIFSPQDSKLVINWAQKNGVNHFDTALAYGDAQEILGVYLDQSLDPVVDTKLDSESCKSSFSIVESARKAMEQLGINQISTLYLHDEGLLQSPNVQEIVIGLNQVLDLGLAKQIGVSVYSEAAVIACKNALPELTVFQVPENICDRRLISSNTIKSLFNDGNTFIVRSVFLQGLLLMDAISIPRNLESAKTHIQTLSDFARANSLTPTELCLAYANSITWASGIVVGVASLSQLREILVNSSPLPAGWDIAIGKLPDDVMDPRKWIP